MLYIAGKSTPKDKFLLQSLTKVYGIGLKRAKEICKKGGFNYDCRHSDLNASQIKYVENIAEKLPALLEADLRRYESLQVSHFCKIGSYKGLRHKKGLPVRGQRTHSNGKKRPFLAESLEKKENVQKKKK